MTLISARSRSPSKAANIDVVQKLTRQFGVQSASSSGCAQAGCRQLQRLCIFGKPAAIFNSFTGGRLQKGVGALAGRWAIWHQLRAATR
jgi:hypothetical protein